MNLYALNSACVDFSSRKHEAVPVYSSLVDALSEAVESGGRPVYPQQFISDSTIQVYAVDVNHSELQSAHYDEYRPGSLLLGQRYEIVPSREMSFRRLALKDCVEQSLATLVKFQQSKAELTNPAYIIYRWFCAAQQTSNIVASLDSGLLAECKFPASNFVIEGMARNRQSPKHIQIADTVRVSGASLLGEFAVQNIRPYQFKPGFEVICDDYGNETFGVELYRVEKTTLI